MKLILEKRISDRVTESTNYSDIISIKEQLGCQNRIESECIGFFPQSNQNLNTFFKSVVSPGDEVLTIGPTNENICQAITACDASCFEFYEKPLFLPDSLGINGKVTERTRLVILGNPNRYTGVVYSEKEIEDILGNSADIILVLDESVFESSRITAIDLITKYDNLALIRSFENDKNEKRSQIEYIISNPAIINRADKIRFGVKYHSSALSAILNNLKNPGNRLGRLKDARQEMLYLSIRLRMSGLNCFLNPDYSLVINTADSEELLFLLNGIGVGGLDLGRFPGLGGNILLPFGLDINVMSIIGIFENMSSDKNYDKQGRNHLTIYRLSESDSKFEVERNREIVSGNRLESNMVF